MAKTQYDGAGRAVATFATDGGGDSSWADAANVDGDTVLEQTRTDYDANGNAIFLTTRQRFHDAAGTGELGTPTSADKPKARVSYWAGYYDKAGRLTGSANVGTNGGAAWTRPANVPSRSDDVLVSGYEYNDAGRVEESTDARGIVTRSQYDMLGRTTKTIEAYTDGIPSDGDDRTTEYTYHASGQVLTLKATLPDDTFQTTEYVYGVDGSTGSDVASNDLLRVIKYPDKTTGQPSSSSADQVSFTYNALGERTSKTDQNGTIHTYSFDVLGRLTADSVTLAGGNPRNVDDAVLRRQYGFDSAGLPLALTTFDAASGGNVVNQVERHYNGLGQLIAEHQEHNGAVDGNTPVVEYSYGALADGSRIESMTYPNGREIAYNYASGIDHSIGRLSSISDSSGTLEDYAYLGLGTVARRSHPETGIDLTYIKLSGESDGDAGDQYTGLDGFGRIVDQRWTDSGGDATDRFAYGHDRNSNRLYEENLVNGAMSELYHADGSSAGYDALNRLTAFQRGTLSDANSDGIPDTVGTAGRSQDWDLDALGNSDSVTTDGTPEGRTHNRQNQLVTKGTASLSFDNNGNTVADQDGTTFVYDAWNHQIEVMDGETSLRRYAFDAMDRRVEEGASHIHYSADWQQIEERNAGGDAMVQYLWSPVYVDCMIERDRDTDANGSMDERVYVQQDANWNVTAITDDAGAVVERFIYDPYGSRTVLTGDWQTTTDGYAFVFGHQGGKQDPISGKVHFRNREYDVDAMRWMQPDPLGYVDGLSLYAAYGQSPRTNLDHSGLTISLTKPHGEDQQKVHDVLREFVDDSSRSDPAELFAESVRLLKEGNKDQGNRTYYLALLHGLIKFLATTDTVGVTVDYACRFVNALGVAHGSPDRSIPGEISANKASRISLNVDAILRAAPYAETVRRVFFHECMHVLYGLAVAGVGLPDELRGLSMIVTQSKYVIDPPMPVIGRGTPGDEWQAVSDAVKAGVWPKKGDALRFTMRDWVATSGYEGSIRSVEKMVGATIGWGRHEPSTQPSSRPV